MHENPPNIDLAEQVANRVLQALQESPGQSYLGGKVIKHRTLQPANEEQLRAQFRAMIAKKFYAKWKC